MQLPPEAPEIIEAVLAQYLASSPANAAFARRHSAVPLYPGWAGTIYLTTRGQFWFVDQEASPTRIETDLNAESEILALLLASERFPQLIKLLLRRGDGATTCSQCHGAGRVPVAALPDLVCAHCTGLGWLSPEYTHSEHDGDHPSFETAMARFRSFMSAQGHGGELRVIDASEVLILGRQLYATIGSLAISVVRAQNVYQAAVVRKLGVQIGAIARTTSGELLASIYGPNTISEAEALMYPPGLKMSIPVELPSVRVVGSRTFQMLRFWSGNRAQRKTREWLKL